jgi:NADH:ubiquinone oxidoreductase subunit 6 (subunit J)
MVKLYLTDFVYNNLSWWPWATFWNDIWFLQFFIIYTLYLVFINTNLYYTLLYLFFEILYIGLYLSLLQFELFTGFLWVLEGTIVFIALLLLFHLNTDGCELRNNLKLNKYIYIISSIFFLLFFSKYYFLTELEFKDYRY